MDLSVLFLELTVFVLQMGVWSITLYDVGRLGRRETLSSQLLFLGLRIYPNSSSRLLFESCLSVWVVMIGMDPSPRVFNVSSKL